jgi:hypothetical protein
VPGPRCEMNRTPRCDRLQPRLRAPLRMPL